MVELSDLDNEVLVKLVGGELVETVVAHDVIGRLMIQCARQPGLAQVLFCNFTQYGLLIKFGSIALMSVKKINFHGSFFLVLITVTLFNCHSVVFCLWTGCNRSGKIFLGSKIVSST